MTTFAKMQAKSLKKNRNVNAHYVMSFLTYTVETFFMNN